MKNNPQTQGLAANALQIALEYHQTGQFPQAEASYRQILHIEPNHIDALHFLGILAYQQGNPDLAISLISKAISLNSAHPVAGMYSNLGTAYQAQNRLVEAIDSFQQAIMLNPQDANTHYNLGVAFHKNNDTEQAIHSYQQALLYQPNHSEAHYNLGSIFQAQQNLEEAAVCYQRVISLNPDYLAAYFNLATVWYLQNKFSAAAECYQQILLANPNDAQAYSGLGAVLQKQGDLSQAIENYKKALALNPNHAETYLSLGNAFKEQGLFDAAIENYHHALALNPRSAEVYYELGNVLELQNNLSAAIENYQQAISVKADFFQAYIKLGDSLSQQGHLDQALNCYQHVFLLNPDAAEAHYNLGIAFRNSGQLKQSVASYRRALALNPDFAKAAMNLSFLLLSMGDFAEGWLLSERRTDPTVCTVMPPHLNFPQWQGESLKGKSLLIWCEQGLGDEIQFCRYVSILKKQGVRQITWVCKKPLKGLLTTLKDVDVVLTEQEAVSIPAHDYWTLALSVPFHCKTTLATIPANLPYLYARPERVRNIVLQLQDIRGFKIGICWKGSATHKNDQNRTPGIEPFKRLFNLPKVRFFTLQPDTRTEFMTVAGKAAVDFGREIEETTFEDAAALIENLDLVIACDTSICHLAGALGKPVWVVLPFEADWRWLREREDNPWYPAARLFRQTIAGDWAEVFLRVENELKKLIHQAH